MQDERNESDWRQWLSTTSDLFGVLAGIVLVISFLLWFIGLSPLYLVGGICLSLPCIFFYVSGQLFKSHNRPIESIGARLNALEERPRLEIPPKGVTEPSPVISEPQPNIVCIDEYKEYVIIDEREVFREQGRVDNSARALGAVFCNEPNPPKKISGINNVEAQIFYYSLDYPESLMHRVHRGCWLNEEFPYVSFGRATVRELIIGVLDNMEFTIFDNNHESADKYLPLSDKTFINPAGYRIRVRLVAGEHGEWCKEFEFELRTPSPASFGFQYLSEKVKRINRDFANHHLGTYIDEGKRLLDKDVERDETFYAEANKWCGDVEKFIREFLRLRQAKQFFNVTELRQYPHATPESSRKFLDELYTRFVNLEEIAKEYRTD